MQIEFRHKLLERIESEAAADTRLPVSVINSCRKKLAFLRSATDEQTLRQWKSLHYEKLRGDKEGQKSIRLNDQWRLVFELDDGCSPPKITVLSVEDYHR